MAEALLAGSLSLLLALVSIRFWNADLSVPFEYHWDALFNLSYVKGLLEHGTPFVNPDLGAPFHSQTLEFPQVAPFEQAMLRSLGLFVDDAAAVMNLYWLATFPMASISAWWAMRALGLDGRIAIIGGVLFSLLPYHFWRGESHVFLSSYWMIPFAAYMIGRLLGGHSLGDPRTLFRGPSEKVRTTALTVAFCVLIGIGPSYYATFAAIMLVAASLVTLAGTGRWRVALSGVLGAGLIALTLTVAVSDSIRFRQEHGANPAMTERTLAQTEKYGLSLTQLVLPATNHRLAPLAEVKARFLNQTSLPSEDAQSLGILGVIGLCFLLAAMGGAAISRKKWAKPVESQAGLAIVAIFFVATIGGVSSLIALGLTAQFRGWNRMSVLIGFFALFGFCLLLERLFRWICPRNHGRLIILLISGAVLLVGLYDQTPARWPNQFEHTANAAEYQRDGRFVDQIEDELPADSMVFQLPYLKYPEGYPPPGHMTDYDPMRGYHHSHDLRWSYAGMEGRSADVPACLKDLPMKDLIPAIRAIGFSGLWIDSFGYETPGEFKAVSARASRLTGETPLISEDGRFHFFDLRAVKPGPEFTETIQAALPESADELQDCTALTAAAGSDPKR
ncbi:MAG: hypothetical protein IPK93_03100 [Solirubrobacterales bacterium]|nr:hypothetical protein [Solirubrobacterales bacterium]